MIKISLPFADDKKKTCFFQISSAMAGGTFLDWGLNYLHGKSFNTVVDKYNHDVSIFSVPENPLDNNQFAHEHEKNHPHKWHDILTMLHELDQNGLDSFTSFYVVVSNQVLVARHKGEIPIHVLHKRNHHSANHQWQMLSKFFIDNPDLPHIFVYPDFDVGPMFWYRYQQFRYQVKTYKDYIGIDHFTGFNLDENQDYTSWDLREQIAIASHNDFNWWCWVSKKQKDMQQFFPNALHIPLSSIFDDQESVIKQLAERFDWKFDDEKWQHWRNIYALWRQRHSYFQWFKQFDEIVERIINSQECIQDLDPIKEILIEHVLMTKGYSIKNFKLERFPRNLGELELEPCIHHLPENPYH